MNMKTLYKILIFEIGVLATVKIHQVATVTRGYKAIGGEFLTIPLLYIIYKIGQAFKARISETNEHFESKKRPSGVRAPKRSIQNTL